MFSICLADISTDTSDSTEAKSIQVVLEGNVPYSVIYILIQLIRQHGLNLKDHLPQALLHINPDLKITNKLSDLTVKVEKIIKTNFNSPDALCKIYDTPSKNHDCFLLVENAQV